jgi:hypothetical protein
MLAKIIGLARSEQWREAGEATAGEFQALTGLDAEALIRLSDSALLAQLIESGPAMPVESKIFMLAALLKSHGDLLAGQGRRNEGREFHLKGLHLLLGTFTGVEASERPDFVPTVEAFLSALCEGPLPVTTNAMLMHHYERIGEYAGAEDRLFEILDAEPGQLELLEFGRLFYQRLSSLSDDALAVGNLPRAEVQSGLAELDERKSRLK